MICDLAITLALGGDCLADIGLLRAEPAVFGRVASDPTVSRTIAGVGVDTGLRRRRGYPPWRMGGLGHRPAGPDRLADRHAGRHS